MRARRPLLALFAAAMLAATPATAQLRVPAPDTAPRFKGATDPVAALVGLPMLRGGGELRRPGREIRIWVGFGLGYPMHMLRVAESLEGVTGQQVLWWPGKEPEGTFVGSARAADRWRREHAAVSRTIERRVAAVGCGHVRRSPRQSACEMPAEPEGGWRAVLARIDSLEAWTLPDQSALPGGAVIGLDGISVVVEARVGDRYRTYSYW